MFGIKDLIIASNEERTLGELFYFTSSFFFGVCNGILNARRVIGLSLTSSLESHIRSYIHIYV